MSLFFVLVAVFWRVGAFAEKDLVVYGATPAGIIAAIAASRQGVQTTVLAPGGFVGGMVCGGLGHSDIGDARVISGIALELFERLAAFYNGGNFNKSTVCWNFEPTGASFVVKDMLKDANVSVQLVSLDPTVEMKGGRILSVDGFLGDAFLDASYEGDLIAASGVPFTYGRESNATYGESEAGVRPPAFDDTTYQFLASNFSTRWPNGTLLPWIQGTNPGVVGSGDDHVQAYNYRLCMTQNTSNLVHITRPENYDPSEFELARRYFEAVPEAATLEKIIAIRGLPWGKTDWNVGGPFSTDVVGASWKYPNSSWSIRKPIIDTHLHYTRSFLYFLQNDTSLPASLRQEMATWGYCADAWPNSNYIPPQLYVREARRMVSDSVFIQSDRTTNTTKKDTIALGSYNMDSHMDFRYAVEGENYPVLNEGWLTKNYEGIFEIPYSIMVPPAGSVANLIVPVPVSASHVAFAAIRLEPTWMMMGSAAGNAAALALQNDKVDFSKVNVTKLQDMLQSQGQIIYETKVPSSTPNNICPDWRP